MLTRKTLIETLRANGMTADATLENVKAFAADLSAKGIDLQDETGAAVNIDAVWNQKSALKIPADTVAKGSASPHGAISDEPSDAGVPQRFSIGSTNRKAYSAKIKSGRAAFHDVDQAEAFGAWARLASLGSADYGSQKKADLDICKKAQVEFNNQLGGALVPVEFIPNLVWLTEQYGVARKIANVVPMSRDVVSVPRKTGLAAMVPVAENGTMSDTDNTYGNVSLTAKKYGVLYKISRELLTDAAVNIADDIARSIAESKAIAEDQAYFLGDGSATYANQVGLGLTATIPSGNRGTATAWGSMTLANFTSVMGTVQYVNPARLAFVCSRQFYYQVMLQLDKTANQFKDLTTGMPGADVTFLGYPVYFAQVMPTATGNSARACYFGDFTGGTMLGDRREIEIQSSDQFYFSSDSLGIRGTSRFCVNIHLDGRGGNGPIGALVST